MPSFSDHFGIKKSQHELDFVDIDTDRDTRVYVDPYAIEIQNDEWSARASEYIRSFFSEVLTALRGDDMSRTIYLMSHLTEPKETFLWVSSANPQGRGVGQGQARQLIQAIRKSRAYETGLLSDLSEMALYVEGVDRDKISDLTTNIIRKLLVEYTKQQCELYDVGLSTYTSPPMWNNDNKNWVSEYVQLPYIDGKPILLIPKYIVRRQLSLDSQEFYNKQLTDFLVAEQITANSSLFHTIKGKKKVFKGEVRERYPKSKEFIAGMVVAHPELLDMYKEIARRHKAMTSFDDEAPTISAVCGALAEAYQHIPSGAAHADDYHSLVMGSLTALFYPDLMQPRKEWEIHDGRKRIDIVYTNSGDSGFFAQRRNDHLMNANMIVVECKNYSNDLGNAEFDQLLGRFDSNRGKFGFITFRRADNYELLIRRCKDTASRSMGYIIPLSDDDLVSMLRSRAQLRDEEVPHLLFRKYREIIS